MLVECFSSSDRENLVKVQGITWKEDYIEIFDENLKKST